MERAPEQRGIVAHPEEITEELGRRTLALASVPEESRHLLLLDEIDSSLSALQREWLDEFWPQVEMNAKRYTFKNQQQEFDDNLAEAYIGLMEAVNEYDPYKPAGKDEHPDINKRRTAFFINKIKGKVLTGWRERKQQRSDTKERPQFNVMYGAPSLDKPVVEDEEGVKTFGDLVEVESERTDDTPRIDRDELNHATLRMLRKNSLKLREMFFKHFHEDKSKADIAREYEVSLAYVSQNIVKMTREVGDELQKAA